MGKTLTPQHELFCLEYIKDQNATRAAEKAGYSKRSAANQASRLIKNDEIVSRIKELQASVANKVVVDTAEILKELARIGYSDIRELYKEDGTIKPPLEWPDDLARAISSIEVEELFEFQDGEKIWTGYTKKIKFWHKNNALELLGKNKALWTDKFEHTGKVTLEQLVAGSFEDETNES